MNNDAKACARPSKSRKVLLGLLGFIFWAQRGSCSGNSDDEAIRQYVAQYNAGSITPSKEDPANYLPTKVGAEQMYELTGTVVVFTNTVDQSELTDGSRDVSITQDISAVGAKYVYRYKIISGAPALLLAGMTGPTADSEDRDCGTAPEIVLLFPLKMGKSWESLECSSPHDTNIKRVIEGRRKVTVKAGTFDTWVIKESKSGPHENSSTKYTWHYYAKGVGVVLEEHLEKGKAKREKIWELVSMHGVGGANKSHRKSSTNIRYPKSPEEAAKLTGLAVGNPINQYPASNFFLMDMRSWWNDEGDHDGSDRLRFQRFVRAIDGARGDVEVLPKRNLKGTNTAAAMKLAGECFKIEDEHMRLDESSCAELENILVSNHYLDGK